MGMRSTAQGICSIILWELCMVIDVNYIYHDKHFIIYIESLCYTPETIILYTNCTSIK